MGKRYLFDPIISQHPRPPTEHKPEKWTRYDWDLFDQRIDYIALMISRALASLPHGSSRPLTYGELRGVLPTEADWASLGELIAGLRIWPDAKLAGLDASLRNQRLLIIKSWNDRINKLIKLADVAQQVLEGQAFPDDAPCPLIDVVNGTRNGTGLLLSWRKPVNRLRQNVPTLILDATANPKILSLWKPDIAVITKARARLPSGCVEVIQVKDSLCPYRGWVPKTERPKLAGQSSDENRKWNNVRRLANFLDVECSMAGDGLVGLIAPKGLIKALEAIWQARAVGRPNNILLGHYGAIAGLDFMKNVRTLVVWGRMSPPSPMFAELARATFCQPVANLDGTHRPSDKYYQMADGSQLRATISEGHPDPCGEMIRAQFVDSELYQAIGRARPFDRTDDRPLKIIIGTSLPTSFPVSQLVTVDELLWPTAIDALAARGLTVPAGAHNKGYAAVLSAATGMSVDAVRAHIKRLNVANLHMNINMGVCHVEGGSRPSGPVAFRVKLSPQDRYWTTVYLRHDLAMAAREALEAEGINPYAVEQVIQVKAHKPLAVANRPPEAAFVLALFRNYADALYNAANDDQPIAHALAESKKLWELGAQQTNWPDAVVVKLGQTCICIPKLAS